MAVDEQSGRGRKVHPLHQGFGAFLALRIAIGKIDRDIPREQRELDWPDPIGWSGFNLSA